MAIQEDKANPEDYSFQKEQLSWRSIEAEKDRRHEIDLRKLDIEGNTKIKLIEQDAATARLKAVSRREMWARVGIGLVKLPALPLAVLLVYLLEKHDKRIPQSLDDFLKV